MEKSKLADQVNELIADAKAQEWCCTFHREGGHPEHTCSVQWPSASGCHAASCAYHFGGDCTCSTRAVDDTDLY